METQLRILKFLAWLGYFNGVFPIKNLLFAKTVQELKFKRLSIPYVIRFDILIN